MEGNYLSHAGTIIRDRVNLIYTDTPFGFRDHQSTLSRYADELRQAAGDALEEEAILIVMLSIHHTEP